MRNTIFFILCLEGAVISFNLSAVAAVLPSISGELGVSAFQAARVVSFYMFPYGLGALLCVPLLKVSNIKNVKLISFLIFSLFSFCSSQANTFKSLSLSRVFVGLGASLVTPLAIILIGSLFAPEMRGKRVGVYFSATFISSLLGVFLSGFLGWRMLFFLPGVLGVLVFILIIFIFPRELIYPKIELGYLNIFKDKRLLIFFAYILLVSLLYHGTYNYLGIFFSQRYNLTQRLISLFITLVSLSGAAGQILGGFLSDKCGRITTSSWGLFILGVAVLSLVFKLPLLVLGFSLVLFGLGWTINHNSVSTVLTDLPDNLRMQAASLNSSLRFLSGSLGVSLSGIILNRSFSAGFLTYAVLFLVLALLTPRILRRI